MTQLSAIFILLFSIAHASDAPSHPGRRSGEQADFLFSEAKESQKNNKVDLAIEDYQKIIQNYPQFSNKFEVYQQLMQLELAQKKTDMVLALAKEALHEHPSRDVYNTIQLLRAEAQLISGKVNQTKTTVEELLKTKPDAKVQTTALLYKAEALSQLGKNKEALSSLDAAKSKAGATFPEHSFDTNELKIRARACSANKRESMTELVDYFHHKNLCFKELIALAGTSPQKESTQVWCDRFQGFEAELKKTKTDSFTREKIQKEMNETKSQTNVWACV